MHWSDIAIKLSQEGREWVQAVKPFLLPVVLAWLHGWMRPQPKFMTKKDDK